MEESINSGCQVGGYSLAPATSHSSIPHCREKRYLHSPALTWDQLDLTWEGSELTLPLEKGADFEMLWIDIPDRNVN